MEQKRTAFVRRVSYSESFKREVILEYLTGSATKSALQNEYEIAGKSAILQWMRELGYTDRIIPYSQFVPADMAAKRKSENPGTGAGPVKTGS